MLLGKHTFKRCRNAFAFLYFKLRTFAVAVFLFLFLFLSNTSLLFAQQADFGNNSQSLELRVTSLEQKYDTQIIQILSNYFDHQKFFVDVRINAEMVEETYSTTQNQILAAPRQNIMMPGLPFLPEENLQARQLDNPSSQTVVNENRLRYLQIINLRVDVYADTSYSEQELEFMSLITGIAAKINEARGDIINVSQLAMPSFSFNSSSPAIQLEEPEKDDSLFASLEAFIPGMILLTLVALMLLIFRVTDKRNKSADPQLSRDHLRDRALPDSGATLPSNTDRNRVQSGFPQPGNELDILTNHFFNQPKEIALLFQYWMANNPDEGARKAAKIVSTVDKHLLKSLKNELDEDHYSAIVEELESIPAISSEEKNRIAHEFNVLIQSKNPGTGSNEKHGQLGLFKFLGHISEHQIVELINEEDRKTAALIIDYLPDQKAARVLELLGKDRTAEIMVGMTAINDLSYQQHSEISSRLFDKVMDLIEVENEAKTGVDSILPILEKLPLEDQKNYIEQLKSMGASVAEVIQSNFVTIDEIPSIDDEILQDAIESIDTSTLLAAIYDLDEQTVNKILSVRPKREQRLLRLELEQSPSISKERSQQAKMLMMGNVRKTVKQYRGL